MFHPRLNDILFQHPHMTTTVILVSTSQKRTPTSPFTLLQYLLLRLKTSASPGSTIKLYLTHTVHLPHMVHQSHYLIIVVPSIKPKPVSVAKKFRDANPIRYYGKLWKRQELSDQWAPKNDDVGASEQANQTITRINVE